MFVWPHELFFLSVTLIKIQTHFDLHFRYLYVQNYVIRSWLEVEVENSSLYYILPKPLPPSRKLNKYPCLANKLSRRKIQFVKLLVSFKLCCLQIVAIAKGWAQLFYYWDAVYSKLVDEEKIMIFLIKASCSKVQR